jgi:chemotaxis receptor (MCP) glutamine deamidase CheD
MAEIDPQVDEVYLQPGEYFFARQPTVIWTILGSCVGAAFWCKKVHNCQR